MSDRLRIAGKLLLIIVCTVCLIRLIYQDETVFRIKQPKGEVMEAQDAFVLMEELFLQAEKEQIPISGDESVNRTWKERLNVLYELKSVYVQSDEAELSYECYIEFIKLLGAEKEQLQAFRGKYREGFFFIKDDFYKEYDRLLFAFGLQEKIEKRELTLLVGNDDLIEEKIAEESILTIDGKIYRYKNKKVALHKCSVVTAYICEDVILALQDVKNEEIELENIWVLQAGAGEICFFYENFEIGFSCKKEEEYKEVVADLKFCGGELIKIEAKTQKIGGKLLRLTDNELELEGVGTFEIQENCKVYRLYDRLEEKSLRQLLIGYDFTDFVLEDGKICAALITRKENMETIRVAIKNDNFTSLYHDEVCIKADCDLIISYGYYEQRKEELLEAGEELCLKADSEYFDGDRILLEPMIKSGEIRVTSLTRSQGVPAYRGSFEVLCQEDGLILINELLLEEYLYSVVPSEMPASYHEEALKAQAVCARTYAYQYMMAPGLADIGANVDDSVGYQVYNNIAENSNSTKAVKETAGVLLFYEGEPVNTYYYSTSCGFGTDAGVWGEENAEKYPYLTTMHINREDSEGGEGMKEEDELKQYLETVWESDYESHEPWYRWNYTVASLDVSELYERLCDRCSARGTQKSAMPEKFKEVYDIKCIIRRDGGVMDELILYTDSGNYKVVSEYDIRYLLNQGGSVVRKDGSKVENGQLLPSAYCVIDVIQKKDKVVGYTIIGGGYGHGVGMSQNGAKAMALEGWPFEEIITFFYPGCELQKVY